jgi:hypothetical protein
MTLFVVRTSSADARTGVAATKKLGSAVTRNRAKRLAREMLRRHKAGPGTDVVLVPRREPPLTLAARVLLGVLKGYKLLLSPLLSGYCRFHPSCADYSAQAIRDHGALRGAWLSARRLGKCRPFGGHGFDPVPHV